MDRLEQTICALATPPVDGGIGLKTAPIVCAAGADVLVCGNAVCGASDPARALQDILCVAESARKEALQ